MSRIGKKILLIPTDVNISINNIDRENQEVIVKGPLGEIKKVFKTIVKIVISNDSLEVKRSNEDKFTKSYHGTVNSIINGMINGVKKAYDVELNIKGVGYKAQLSENKITLNVGFSHPVIIEIPNGIKVEIPKPTIIKISGIDKQFVTQFAAKVYLVKKPEPYGGKGIMYKDQYIRRKAGKSTGGKK